MYFPLKSFQFFFHNFLYKAQAFARIVPDVAQLHYMPIQVVVLAVCSCCSWSVGRFYRNLYKIVVFITAGNKNLFQSLPDSLVL